MTEPPDAPDGQLDQAEFKKKMLSKLQTTGVVSAVKSQLRAQLLSQLQKGQIVHLGPPPGDRPGLKRHALNSMIADYMHTVQYNYSLSVFKEESGIESRPILTEDELIDVLKLDRETAFYQSYMKAKAHGGPEACFILNILSAISEAAAAKGKESFTQTLGGDRYQLEVRMQQLEEEYQSRLRAQRLHPNAGVEERLALYRQEIEEQAAGEVARQVERIREMEVAAARLDEASKARRAMEAERLELERMHSERVGKLRSREEEMMDKLRRQQRDVENVAYEHRQRILREEERVRNHKNELRQAADSRQEQLKQLERTLELRERAVAAREAAAERKIAEAAEAAAQAGVEARQDAEREFMELKASITHQRMQLEVDRNRVLELRSEATAEVAAARAREDRLRGLEAARAEAEARAAAHAADAEVCRMQCEKLALELGQARDELSRRVAAAADGADAMLQNAAGAMNMLNAEATASRAANAHVREALSQLDRAREEAAAASAAAAELAQERTRLHSEVAHVAAECEALRSQLGRAESLMDEAVAARGQALSAADDAGFRALQAERELGELRSALARAREEAVAARAQLAARRPPSRGADSPGRRSITLSPTRRHAAGAASISGMSLGIALGGGPGGHLAGGHGPGPGGHHHAPGYGHGWPHTSSGGSGMGVAGATPTLSQMEFPIAAAPPRDPTLERLERLRRQEDILAGQEEGYRKRLAMMQEDRERGAATSAHFAAINAAHQHHMQPPRQQQQQRTPEAPAAADPQDPQHAFYDPATGAPLPYMTYVMHGSQPYGQAQLQSGGGSPGAAAAQAQAKMYEQHHMMQQAYEQQEQARQQQEEFQHMHRMRQQEQQQQQQYQQQELRMQHQLQMEHQERVRAQGQGQQQQHPGSTLPQRDNEPHHMQPPAQSQGAFLLTSQPPPSLSSMSHQEGEGSLLPGLLPYSRAGEAGTPPPTPPVEAEDSDGAPGADLPPAHQQPQPQRSSLPASGPATVPSQSSPPGTHGGAGERPAAPSRTTSASRAPLDPSGGGATGAHRQTSLRSLTSQLLQDPRAQPEAAPAPQPTAAPQPLLPPAGLGFASFLSNPAPSPGAKAPPLAIPHPDPEPAAPPPPPPPPSAEPAPAAKPTIPGLVIVRDFTPRGSTAGMAPPPQTPPPEPAAPPPPPPPPTDVQSAMEAKMRMLQEQRERALAAQLHQQQHPPPRRLTSRASRSSRVSAASADSDWPALTHSPTAAAGGPLAQPAAHSLTGGAAGGGGEPRMEDSSSEVAAREAGDTVAAELSSLSALHRGRGTLGRRNSLEGAASRQGSVNRREVGRLASFARSEASMGSVEVPGLAGQSARALSMAQTLDDIPSSLDGYDLPGLNEDEEDEGMEAPGGDEGFGAFAAEFSAGSVF